MSSPKTDLSIFNKFNFDRAPVGVKFLLKKPEGIEKLDKNLAFCEMLKEAQQGSPFYAVKGNFECAGPLPLGMVDIEPIFESGQMGPQLEIFKEARANRRIYYVLPKLARNSCTHVAFSPLDELSFEPDVLIVTANPGQAEILLRAMSYTTGKMWSSKGTPVLGCAWLYVYPYISGELNFTITGLCFGMKARQVLPEGLILISIPYDLLPSMIDNLNDMKWVLSSYTEGRDEYNKRFKRESDALRQEFDAE